jgi:hypothetical protein
MLAILLPAIVSLVGMFLGQPLLFIGGLFILFFGVNAILSSNYFIIGLVIFVGLQALSIMSKKS